MGRERVHFAKTLIKRRLTILFSSQAAAGMGNVQAEGKSSAGEPRRGVGKTAHGGKALSKKKRGDHFLSNSLGEGLKTQTGLYLYIKGKEKVGDNTWTVECGGTNGQSEPSLKKDKFLRAIVRCETCCQTDEHSKMESRGVFWAPLSM